MEQFCLHPSVFFLLANAFLSLRKRAKEDKISELENRITKIEDKI